MGDGCGADPVALCRTVQASHHRQAADLLEDLVAPRSARAREILELPVRDRPASESAMIQGSRHQIRCPDREGERSAELHAYATPLVISFRRKAREPPDIRPLLAVMGVTGFVSVQCRVRSWARLLGRLIQAREGGLGGAENIPESKPPQRG